MSVRLHLYVFIGGVLLVLVAAVLLLHASPAGRTAVPGPALRAAETVQVLEGGCLTCHRAAQQEMASSLLLAFHPLSTTLELPALPHRAAAPSDLAAAVEADLLDLGRGLLALPAGRTAPDGSRQQALTAYLGVVDSARAAALNGASPAEWRGILGQIARLNDWLRGLEYNASPVRYLPVVLQPVRTHVALITLAPAVPHAEAQRGVRLEAPGAAPGNAWAGGGIDGVPAEIVFAALRRGPPGGSAALESV